MVYNGLMNEYEYMDKQNQSVNTCYSYTGFQDFEYAFMRPGGENNNKPVGLGKERTGGKGNWGLGGGAGKEKEEKGQEEASGWVSEGRAAALNVDCNHC